MRLDARDWRALHRLGDLHRIRLNRFREAVAYYAQEARCEEGEGFHAWAIALEARPASRPAFPRPLPTYSSVSLENETLTMRARRGVS